MATVDLSKIQYDVVAVLWDGRQLKLDEVAENIAWEENEKELAVRLNLTLRDIPYNGGRLSQMLALCTVIYLYSDWGSGQKEVFRGIAWTWEHSETDDDAIILTAYDLLYYLQKSKDCMYFAKGKSTKSIISNIFSTWAITMGSYTGPSVIHEKILYKNKTIANMINETLDDAKKLGGGKAFVRASEGLVHVVGYGTNELIYSFTAEANLTQVSDKYSMVNLVTRVKIFGKEDYEGRPSVETTLTGRTEYGILQEVQTMGSLTLEEAKAKAQDILDEKGDPQRTIRLTAPDFPAIRKGDRIHVATDKLNGFFFVLGVSHNATNMTMQMEVEPA